MSLTELYQWLPGRTDPPPTSAQASMPDGHVTAVVAGRYRSTRPAGSVLVLGLEAEVFNHGSTSDFAAI